MFHRWIIFVCFSFVLLLPARIFSQTGKLSGYVLDHYSGKALPGTNIVIKEKISELRWIIMGFSF